MAGIIRLPRYTSTASTSDGWKSFTAQVPEGVPPFTETSGAQFRMERLPANRLPSPLMPRLKSAYAGVK
jgi:hypothetical protein